MTVNRAHRGRLGALIGVSASVTMLAGLVATPAPVAAWGAIAPSTTHQYIDEQAWAVLTADPAYTPAAFPTKASIDAHEGVNWKGMPDNWWDLLEGPGPDSAGKSPFSWHYYNPNLAKGDKGGGPAAAAAHFASLLTEQAAGKADDAGKAAAWAGHFLADMYVPYHTVGMSRDAVTALYAEQEGSFFSWSITLPREAFGPIEMCYGCGLKDWSWLGSENFKVEVWRYLWGAELPATATPDPGASPTAVPANADLDWFDPWYYNGTTPAWVKTSSHIVWEGMVSHTIDAVTGYDARWQNGAASFESPGSSQRAAVEALAIAAATETASDLKGHVTDEKAGLTSAVQSVATIWRASFSAMRPDFAVEAAGEANLYKISPIVVNAATENPTGVKAKLTASGCTVRGGDTHDISTLGKADKEAAWTVEAKKPEACTLTLETIGAYKQPDLQYAKLSRTMGTAGAMDVVFCIDVTASMDDDIANVKAAASSIVDKLAAKDPGFRAAVIAYRDWDDTEGYEMFRDIRFSSDRAAIVSAINGLTVGGGDDEPEAVLEALMRAIGGKTIGGWRTNVSKTIILMGDAPPHDPSRNGLTAASVAKAAFDADPIVIQTIVVGNEGDFSTDAETAFADLAQRSGGSMVRAEDAGKVVDAIDRSIDAIKPADAGIRPEWLGLGIGLALVLVLLAAVLLRRGRRQPAPAVAGGWAMTGGMPAVAGWGPPTGSAGAAPPIIGASVATGTRAPTLVFGPPADPGAPRFGLSSVQVLGSAPDCTIVLADPRVRPHHARIYTAGASFAIADADGTGGTWVNGAPVVGPAWLSPGDVVAIGPYQFTFVA